MKLELDRETKLVLLHWLKNGCIDTEELKTLETMGSRLAPASLRPS